MSNNREVYIVLERTINREDDLRYDVSELDDKDVINIRGLLELASQTNLDHARKILRNEAVVLSKGKVHITIDEIKDILNVRLDSLKPFEQL